MRNWKLDPVLLNRTLSRALVMVVLSGSYDASSNAAPVLSELTLAASRVIPCYPVSTFIVYWYYTPELPYTLSVRPRRLCAGTSLALLSSK